jgi:hypothetical protein
MPRRKDESEDTEVLKVRISKSLKEQCRIAQASGAMRNSAESSFLGYLVYVGLAKYQSAILPAENSQDEGITAPVRKSAVS